MQRFIFKNFQRAPMLILFVVAGSCLVEVSSAQMPPNNRKPEPAPIIHPQTNPTPAPVPNQPGHVHPTPAPTPNQPGHIHTTSAPMPGKPVNVTLSQSKPVTPPPAPRKPTLWKRVTSWLW